MSKKQLRAEGAPDTLNEPTGDGAAQPALAAARDAESGSEPEAALIEPNAQDLSAVREAERRLADASAAVAAAERCAFAQDEFAGQGGVFVVDVSGNRSRLPD